MPSKKSLKRYLIMTIIGTLVFSAIIAITVVLFGGFSSIEARIMGSTTAIGIFSITSLANLRNLESEHTSYRRFAWISIGCSLIAMLFTLSLIWISLEHTPWKPTLVFFVLAVSTAHASLLLPTRARSTWLDTAVTATLACIAFVAGFLIYLIIAGGDGLNTVFYRLLGVFAILDVLGTIVTPILARTAAPTAPAPPTPPPSEAPSAPQPSDTPIPPNPPAGNGPVPPAA